MSFYGYKDVIEEGDLVLAFISRNQIKPITVKRGERLNSRYGHFDHDKMIGMKYGQQMGGINDYGYIHLLHPSPELWTISLPHRTQIVYSHDSSYIIQRLNVCSGSRVIEAGTGSASFTHSFARTVGLDGRLFTYEFHEPRFLEARRELEEHGITQNTLITHRDVCNDGFDMENIPQGFDQEGGIQGEAVFLDLPSPWIAVKNLKSVITNRKRVGLCCFSPCIEQVDKTVKALQDEGWSNIEMVEVQGRRWEARREMVRSVDDVVKRLKNIQSRKQMGIEGKRASNVNPPKRKIDEVDTDETPEPSNEKPLQPKEYNPFGKGTRVKEGDSRFDWRQVTKIESEIKTHTSYLTFAYMNPSS